MKGGRLAAPAIAAVEPRRQGWDIAWEGGCEAAS